jgi:hypothetical protein
MRTLTVKDELLTKAKEKILVRPKDFEKIKGARVHLSQLVASGELVKVGRGLYALADGGFARSGAARSERCNLSALGSQVSRIDDAESV